MYMHSWGASGLARLTHCFLCCCPLEIEDKFVHHVPGSPLQTSCNPCVRARLRVCESRRVRAAALTSSSRSGGGSRARATRVLCSAACKDACPAARRRDVTRRAGRRRSFCPRVWARPCANPARVLLRPPLPLVRHRCAQERRVAAAAASSSLLRRA